MRYALNLAEDGRILSITFAKYAPADAALVDAPPAGNVADYRYVNGEYIYDPLPPDPPTPAPVSMWDELDAAYQEGVDSV